MQIDMTNISKVMLLLWGRLTCLCSVAFAVYHLCVIYKMIKEVNIACEGDGEKTAGLGMLILLNYVTLGIYSFIWCYEFGKRLAKNAPRYGMEFKKLGRTMIVLKIFKMLFSLLFCAAFIFYIFQAPFTDMLSILSMFVTMAFGFVGFLVSHLVLMGIIFKYTNKICAGYNTAYNL